MTDGTPLPHFVQIEPVGQCNLRCTMCPIQYRHTGAPGQPSAFIDFEVFRRLVTQFPQMTELQLQGLGEPFLHPRFLEMVRLAAARGIRVSTNTNMTVMTAELARECVQSGLHTLHVSLDGASAETYQAIRIKARFDRVLRNLRRVVHARAELSTTMPEIQLVVVVMRQNLGELPDLIRLAHAEGVDTVSVQHLCHDFGEASLPAHYHAMRAFVDDQTLLNEDVDRVAQIFDESRTIAHSLGVSLRLPNLAVHKHPPGTPGRTRCDWPWRGSYISYDGKAMPCCMVSTPDRIHFGDMAQDGVEAVWNNTGYTAFRNQLSSDTPPDVCKSCALYSGNF